MRISSASSAIIIIIYERTNAHLLDVPILYQLYCADLLLNDVIYYFRAIYNSNMAQAVRATVRAVKSSRRFIPRKTAVVMVSYYLVYI